MDKNVADSMTTRIRGRVWAAAGTLGIIFGWVEMAIVWSRQPLEGLKSADPELLWVAPVLYGMGATGLAIGLGGIRKIAPRLSPLLAVGVVSYLGFLNTLSLLLLTGRLAAHLLAIGLACQSTRLLKRRYTQGVTLLSGVFPWVVGAMLGLAITVPLGKDVRERYALAVLPPSRAGAPNVLLITLDTLRADHLSVYGYHRATPHLQQFASEGLVFADAIAPSSWTLPSHASIMTGRFTYEHNAEVGTRLDGKYPTLAEAFAVNGYATAAFVANPYYCTKSTGLDRGFGRFNDFAWGFDSLIYRTHFVQKLVSTLRLRQRLGWYEMLGRRSATQINREFLAWLPKRQGRPFFVWLNYFDTHDPYYAPMPFDTIYATLPFQKALVNHMLPEVRFGSDRITQEQARELIDSYDSAIAYLDTELGGLLQALRRQGLYDQTILVITSDHGEAFGEHRIYGHGHSLYRELLHVPLIIRYPKAIAAGSRVTGPVSLRHLPTTVSALAELKLTYAFPGRPLDTGSPPEFVLSELRHNPEIFPPSLPVARGDLISIISHQWHAIFLNDEVELYTRHDKGEQQNVAATLMGKAALLELRNVLRVLHPQLQVSRLQGSSE